MGHALSWLAVKGRSSDEIHRLLGYRSTRSNSGSGRRSLVTSRSAEGWDLILAPACDHKIVRKPLLEQLSQGCGLIACTVEEHVMLSKASCWKDGRQLWSVKHQGEEGLRNLEARGVLPPAYEGIRDRFIAMQEDDDAPEVDYLFEIPLVLARSITGFKHDEESPAFETVGFKELEPLAKESWFRRFFSK